MFELATWLPGAMIVTLAATVQSLTGFGFGMTAVPFLMLFFIPKYAVILSVVISFFSAFMLFMKIKKDTQWKLVKTFLLGAIMGLPFGIIIQNIFNVTMLKAIISIIICLLSLSMLFDVKFNIKSDHLKWKVGVGSISGILTGSMGLPGPPIVLFLSCIEMTKEKFKATVIAFFALVYLSTIVLYAFSGSLTPNIFVMGISYIPFAYLGINIGKKLFNKISQHKFKKMVLALLIIASIYSLITVLL